MSQPSSSSSNFRILFDSALQDYKDKTGSTLADHPIAKQLETCESVNSITAILQEQTRSFREFRENDGRLMKALNSSVDVLCTPSISSTLNEAIGLVPFPPAKAIFAGFGILLTTVNEMRASYDALIDLFASFENFLSRLSIYAGIPPTPVLTNVLVKIIVELISTLALATKQVKQGRFKKFMGKLRGEKDIEATLQRLDRLTLDEGRATAAQTLEVVYGLVQKKKAIMNDADGNEAATGISRALESIQEIVSELRKEQRDKLQQDVRNWLSPPDPWKNHNLARKSRHSGTGAWWIEGDAYSEWNSSGPSSLLWIHGKPGAGKSVICSAIIEDIRTLQKSGLASLAFFYCDFRDDQKKNVRGLLSSLLVQLGGQSDVYSAVLSDFYAAHGCGSQHASDDDLSECLKEVLRRPGQPTVYIVVDALDECPIATGSLFPREEVLEVLEDLVKSQIPNLRICVTSRPEADILPILEPLAFHFVSLHGEDGQVHDIAEYIKSFVHNDREMRRWKTTDKELVIEVLTKKADGMFRWVFCQLVYLRRCIPARIRRALNELPETLDETYARSLKEIDEPNWEYAHRLFQCVAAAPRPFRVEELAEFLAFDFDARPTPAFLADWRPEDPTHTVLSTCPSLLSVVDNEPTERYLISPAVTLGYCSSTPTESPVIPSRSLDGASRRTQKWVWYQNRTDLLPISVDNDEIPTPPELPHPGWTPSIESLRPPPLVAQFAHFSVREYLTSARHAREKDTISRFHVSMTQAHTIIAQACLGVLLHLDENITKDDLDDFPLAEYAAEHWVGHAQFENVVSNVLDGMKRLFDPSKSHLSVWVWIYDPESKPNYLMRRLERSERPVEARRTPLHYAAVCNMHDIATFLIVEHSQDVNARVFDMKETPLQVSSRLGHVEITRVLLKHGAETEVRDNDDNLNPLERAILNGHVELVQVLLEHGADANARDEERLTPLHWASGWGQPEVVQLLLNHGADVSAQSKNNETPLHRANGEEVARLLLEHGADANALDIENRTPLHRVSNNVGAARVLLEHGVDVNAQEKERLTPLHWASSWGQPEVVQLLLDHGADVSAQSKNNETPLHLAYGEEVARLLLEHGADANALNIENWTPLHHVSNIGYVGAAQALEHGVDANAQDKEGLTPLHWVSSWGQPEVVQLLLNHGADVSAQSKNNETPLHRANGEEVSRLLLEHGADANALDIENRTPLHCASRFGDVGAARLLLEHDADANALDIKNRTPLHHASKFGHVGAARVLLELGVDANAQDKDRRTPLHWASHWGRPEVAQVLLSHGADVSARCKNNETPLHRANGDEVARLLLEHGADANALDIKNQTPLHHASEDGHVAAAHVLLECGVNANARDANNATPLHLASDPYGEHDKCSDKFYYEEFYYDYFREFSGNCHDVVQLLLQYGSDIHARDDEGRTPYMRATAGEDDEMMKLLLEHETEEDRVVMTTDGQGNVV